MPLKFTILGCGSSMGVPRPDGHWGNCDPKERKNYRSRCSAMISNSYINILFDTSPDLRSQLIREKVKNVDKVFVPVQPSPVDLMATIPFLNLTKQERKKAVVILNRVMPRVRLTEAMILRLRYAGAKIARTRISSKTIFAETFSAGRGVVDISINSDASREIINLGNEILRNL